MKSHRVVLSISVALAVGCAARRPATPPGQVNAATANVKEFAVDDKYGSLDFRGAVTRYDRGLYYEFGVQLEVELDVKARTNRTTRVALTEARLVATRKRTADGSWEALECVRQPVSVILSDDGERRRLPDLTLRIAKAVAAQAEHLGLSVTDGRLLWPVTTDLRQ